MCPDQVFQCLGPPSALTCVESFNPFQISKGIYVTRWPVITKIYTYLCQGPAVLLDHLSSHLLDLIMPLSPLIGVFPSAKGCFSYQFARDFPLCLNLLGKQISQILDPKVSFSPGKG